MTVKHMGARALLALCVPVVMGATAPAAVAGVVPMHGAGDGTEQQQQEGTQSNSTNQRSESTARSVQVSPAANVGILNSGDQGVWQDNDSHASSESGNQNWTGQNQGQHQQGSVMDESSSWGSYGDDGAGTSLDQNQSGTQSNNTDQKSESSATSRQENPAGNLGIVNSGDQGVEQDNDSGARSGSANSNETDQKQLQNQVGGLLDH